MSASRRASSVLPKPRSVVHDPSNRTAFPLVLDPALHEQATTDSRQIRHPDDFLHAVRWAVAQALHPRATTTTVTIAEKLAAKMNREGQMAYARERLAAELNLSLSTVRNHTRVLRELGLLVWAEHGTRRNVLRTKNPDVRPTSYKPTATIFAATAPAPWDQAMGRSTVGHGYSARLVAVDDLGRAYETALAKSAQGNRKGTGSERRCPPSVSGFSSSEKFEQMGGKNYTRTRGATPSSQPNKHKAMPAVTPSKLAELISAAEHIKAHVPWLAKVCPRRLAFQLRNRLLAATGLSALINELRNLASSRPIRRPLGFLAAYLKQHIPAVERADAPIAWAPAQPVAPAPVRLPKYAPTPEPGGPDMRTDPALWEQWDAYCAARAFEEARERWRDTERQRDGFHELVPVYSVVEIPVDDEGRRWAAMVEDRHRTQVGVLERSAPLRAHLRAQYAALRTPR